ncbi:J domain-containing protein, partial [Hyella patelloides]|uniref:J domain-containing protein n=1 Tax=Hyella patelloides TaxID=1982969 RepID=UPI0011AAAE3A
MSFTIKHGLFRANITDYHAILGVSLDSDPKKIRLKYLRTAQKLHPDTCRANSEGKKLASQLLSRLVNPAYEQLSNKTQFAEHQLVLTQIGKRYAEKSARMTIASEPAKKLLQAEKNLAQVYHQVLKELTANQYQEIEQVLIKTAVISELNLVYLMLTHKQGINREEKVLKQQLSQPTNSSQKAPARPPMQPTSTVTNNQPSQSEEPTPESRAASYLRRAKEYMAKGNYNDAVSELRDALKINPNSSTGHALMGKAYLYQNQLTMAKVHINKAHKANPKDPVAIESKELLEKLSKRQKRKSASSSPKSSDKKKSSDSGFFSGFF